MYSAHKMSPPTQSALTPRTPMSGLDTGYSSTHHRSRNDRENGRTSDADIADRPASPNDHTIQATAPTNGTSATASNSTLATTLFALKKARQQPESPKGKRRARGLLSALLESKHSQTLFLISIVVNLALLVLVLTSVSRSLPVCLRSSSPDMQGQALGLHNIDTGNSDLTPAVAHNTSRQTQVVTSHAEGVQPVQPTDSSTPTHLPVMTEPQPGQSQQTTQPVDVPAASAADSPSESSSATDRPFANDISEHLYNVEAHTVTWEYCLAPASHIQSFTYDELGNLSLVPDIASFPSEHCPTTATVEQHWQIGWYGGQVAVGVTERNFPLPQKCVQLPPDSYVWPSKYTDLPAADQSFLNWRNLRVESYEQLIVFNQGTPKNLYHFNAPRYDLDGLDELSLGAKYIPFAKKIRNFLDIGAGGGSLGLLLKRKYGVEAMSIIFPDWPYCEYITERGGLCVLVDVMEAMPFARASFDAVHISWVYHGQQPAELVQMYTEVDRIVRPGGYVWQRGGWSLSQIAAQKRMFDQLGYVQLYEKLDVKPEDITKRISFGPDLPFEAEWTCIYVKPIGAERKVGCGSAPEMVRVVSAS